MRNENDRYVFGARAEAPQKKIGLCSELCDFVEIITVKIIKNEARHLFEEENLQQSS